MRASTSLYAHGDVDIRGVNAHDPPINTARFILYARGRDLFELMSADRSQMFRIAQR